MIIDRATRQQLIDMLTPHVSTVRERRAILGAAFLGTSLLDTITLEGTPRDFASNLIIASLNYGELDGDPAIIPVLEEIKARVGHDKQRQIDALIDQLRGTAAEIINPKDPQNRVFIAYRRKNSTYIGRAVFQDLRAAGYDVFFDVEGLDSAGNFEQAILRQVAARPHFVVILAPGTLEGFADPDDWLRREVEYALQTGRNVIPLLFNGFEFKDYRHLLTGTLAQLERQQGIPVPQAFFNEAMARLRGMMQNAAPVPVTDAPQSDDPAVMRRVAQAAAEADPTEEQLETERKLQQRERELAEMQAQVEAAAADLERQRRQQDTREQSAQRQMSAVQAQLEKIQAAQRDLDNRWATMEAREKEIAEREAKVRAMQTDVPPQQTQKPTPQPQPTRTAPPPQRQQPPRAQPEPQTQAPQVDVPRLRWWNPLHGFMLFWWLFYQPGKIVVHDNAYGQEAKHGAGNWLATTLTWMPVFIPSMALALRPELAAAWRAQTAFELYGMAFPLAVIIPALLITIAASLIPDDSIAISVTGVLALVVAFGVVSFVAGGLAFGTFGGMLVVVVGAVVAGIVADSVLANPVVEGLVTLGVAVGLAGVVADDLAFGLAGVVAGGLVGIVASVVAGGVGAVLVGVMRGIRFGHTGFVAVGGAAVGVAVGLAGFAAVGVAVGVTATLAVWVAGAVTDDMVDTVVGFVAVGVGGAAAGFVAAFTVVSIEVAVQRGRSSSSLKIVPSVLLICYIVIAWVSFTAPV